jgi:lipoprotein signal peptidase
MTHQRNAGAFGLTETQRGWVVGAVVLVTVAVCLMASGYRLELVRA